MGERKLEINNFKKDKIQPYIDRPILLTGCARSGTSMTAGIIDLCGAWGGSTSRPNKNNRKGMFENTYIRNHLVKPFLVSIGADPMGQDPLPDIEKCKLISVNAIINWRRKVLEVICGQGYTGNQSWYYKGAKLCLIWPLWHRAFPKAKWIIIRRQSKDIVKSCLKTSFMRAYNNENDWYKWVDYHKDRFLEMKQAGLDIHCVWPQKMIDFDLLEIGTVIAKLGLKWDQKVVEDFIEPAYWSGGQSTE